jgi:hypothetical protein
VADNPGRIVSLKLRRRVVLVLTALGEGSIHRATREVHSLRPSLSPSGRDLNQKQPSRPPGGDEARRAASASISR